MNFVQEQLKRQHTNTIQNQEKANISPSYLFAAINYRQQTIDAMDRDFLADRKFIAQNPKRIF